MKDDRPPLDPPDDEELRSAAALARALDGGPAEPDLPQAALEAAALLRLSAGAGRLAEERRAQIRRELVEELARAPKTSRAARRGFAWPRWLLLAFPLAGAAALSLLVFVRNPEPVAQRQRTTFPSDDAVPNLASAEGAVSRAPAAAANAAPEKNEALSSADSTSGADSIASEPSVTRLADSAREPAASLAPAASVGRAVRSRPAGGENSRSEASSGVPALTAKPVAPAAAPATAADGEPEMARSLPAAKPATAKSRRTATPGAMSSERALGLRAAGRSPADESISGRTDDRSRRALAAIDREVGARRAALLARVDHAALRRTHAEADAANGRSELERSQRNLIQTLATLGDGLDPTDARLVRQDLYCRLAETALRLGEPRAALEWTRRGIDLDGPANPFLAQLRALEGDAWAALGDAANAAASYMKALRLHEALLDESLDGR